MKIDRRKLLQMIGISPALAAVPSAHAEAARADKPVETSAASNAKLTALSPKGTPPPVNRFPMAPRLNTSLDGKTVYLVDTGFMSADVVIRETGVWFQQNMPSVKVVSRKKAGTYPEQDPKLWAEIKANAAACIMAIGHCAGCTPATVSHCVTMEKMGIPSVPIVTRAYYDLAKSTAADRGMPTLRTVYTVHPMWGRTPEDVLVLLEGSDPITHANLMKEIIDGLTLPLTAEDQKSGIFPVSAGPASFGPETSDNLQRYFMDNQMTDFMPIIIPTEQRVQAMLKGTSHKPDEVVGKSAGWTYTVKDVAVNAVMAGCDPSYLPVVLAIASTGDLALGGSTTSFGYAMVVNGPIRDKLGMNYSTGALSPFAQPNATIGRAWSLLGKNLAAGAVPGETYWGGQGNNLNYNNVVIAEDEKNSKWSPFHVQKGFKSEENVVSLFNGWDVRMGHGAKGSGAMMPKFDEQISSMFPTLARMFNILVILDPLTVDGLVAQGYDTKEKLQQWLWTNSTVSGKEYRESFLAHVWIYPRALKGEEPMATWWKQADDARIPVAPKPEDINLVVAGGQTNAFFQVGNMNYSRSVSIDKWS
jgi:hypothetical protein